MKIINWIVGIVMLIAFCCEGPIWITLIGVGCMVWLFGQAVLMYGWPFRNGECEDEDYE